MTLFNIIMVLVLCCMAFALFVFFICLLIYTLIDLICCMALPGGGGEPGAGRHPREPRVRLP